MNKNYEKIFGKAKFVQKNRKKNRCKYKLVDKPSNLIIVIKGQ